MSEPEQPRRRHSDVVDDRLEKVEKRIDWLTSEQARQGLRLSDVEQRVEARTTVLDVRVDTLADMCAGDRCDKLERTIADHERWFNELQRFMDSARQRDERGPRRLWLYGWEALRRWWEGS